MLLKLLTILKKETEIMGKLIKYSFSNLHLRILSTLFLIVPLIFITWYNYLGSIIILFLVSYISTNELIDKKLTITKILYCLTSGFITISPFILYQIQTKFRDEERPRGGLLRCREFHMKDAYSFASNSDQLDSAYEDMIQAYNNIFDRCGLSTVMVEADSGAIGGKDSHEFIALSNIGEDTIAICTSCKYGANVERAEFVKPVNSGNSSNAIPEEVHTPGITDINALSSFLNVSKSDLLKSMFYLADGKLIVVVLEGDYEVNEIKLRNTLNIKDLAIASDSLIRSAGFIPGFASPVGDHKDVTVVVDDSVIENKNYVVGANKVDYHLKNVQYGRDFKKTTVSIEIGSDLALVKDGDLCLHCN